jgi:hypothetical protein
MNRNEVTAEQRYEVDRFIAKHVHPTPGKSIQNVHSRLQHWIEVANNPPQFTSSLDAKDLSKVRSHARQNIRRLVLRHPNIAAQLNFQPEVTR